MMRVIYRMLARFSGLFRRTEPEDELEREMNAHLDLATDEYIRKGLSPEAARRQALMESGGLEQAKEAYRDQRTMPRLSAIARDFSFAWRSLRRSPAYAIPVIISLALGIGLNTSVFAVMEDVIRRPLPYPNEAELITVGKLYEQRQDYSRNGVDWTNYDPDIGAWQSGARTLDGIAAFNTVRATINDKYGSEFVLGGKATANLLKVLGAQPLHGRWFSDAEVGDRVVVLSYDLWQRRYMLDPNIVGQSIKIAGIEYNIVGVLPRQVGLPFDAQYWTPWAPCSRCADAKQIVARPKPGITLSTITAELEALSPSIQNTRKHGTKIRLVVQSLHEQLFGSARPALQLLLGAAVLLFLIACANVANLSLARTLERRRELAVRIALGAGRQSLALLILAENVLLAVIGGTVGLVIAYAASATLGSIAPAEINNVRSVQVNAGSVLYALMLAMFTAIAVSIVPVLNITANRTQPMMGQWAASSGRGRRLSRVRQGLVMTQLALTLLLITGAGLLIRSVAALARPDRLGFSPAGVVIANIQLNHGQYGDSTSWRVFTEQLTNKLAEMPGVQSVAVGPAPLLAGQGSLAEGVDGVFTYHDPLQLSEVNHDIWVKDIGTQYLGTFRIKLKKGRNFQATDNAQATRVAIVNSAAARIFFHERNPIGLPLPTRFFNESGFIAPVIVGVVDDMLQKDLTMSPHPEVFFAAQQRGFGPTVTLAIRTNAPASVTIAGARKALAEIDPLLAASRLESMDSILNALLSTHTFLLWLLVGFAGLALILSVIGLYAIVSYLVAQRTVEIGVRMALGAQRVQVFGLVLGEGVVLVVAGVTVGSLAAFALSQLLAKFLFEVQRHDALTFAVSPVILSVVALFATYVPAMRATRVDPAITLRAD
ncbi:MAG: ABC transporter permease [Gemmatimonas sp.]